MVQLLLCQPLPLLLAHLPLALAPLHLHASSSKPSSFPSSAPPSPPNPLPGPCSPTLDHLWLLAGPSCPCPNLKHTLATSDLQGGHPYPVLVFVLSSLLPAMPAQVLVWPCPPTPTGPGSVLGVPTYRCHAPNYRCLVCYCPQIYLATDLAQDSTCDTALCLILIHLSLSPAPLEPFPSSQSFLEVTQPLISMHSFFPSFIQFMGAGTGLHQHWLCTY